MNPRTRDRLGAHGGPPVRTTLSHARLEQGMFPQSDDLLRRVIHMDLQPLFTERDEMDIVRAIRKVAVALL